MNLIDFIQVWFVVELMWEPLSQIYSHPIDAESGEPIRPPMSILDYLFYNPGVLND